MLSRDLAPKSLRMVTTLLSMSILGLTAFGCGGGDGSDLKTGRVSGKVSHKGQPVTGGTVSFVPVAAPDQKTPTGKPAAGIVKPDGTFVLSTYGIDDGAIIGKHKVGYTPPLIEIDEKQHTENSPVPVSPFAGLIPSTAEVEVKAGPNTIDIELVPNPKAAANKTNSSE